MLSSDLEVNMNRKELEQLVVKDNSIGDNKVVGIRLPVKLINKLKLKNIDIQATVRNLLERLAE